MLVLIQACKLLCLFYMIVCSLSKLLISNAYWITNHLDIQDNQNLTIWIKYNRQVLQYIFRIIDQNDLLLDNMEVNIYQYELTNISIEFINSIRQTSKYFQLSQEKVDLWNRFQLDEENCTNTDVFCTKIQNKTLIIYQSGLFQIQIYDNNQNISEEKIMIQNLPLAKNNYILKFQNNELQIDFYAKFICNLTKSGAFYSQSIIDYVYLAFSYNQNDIQINLNNYSSGAIYKQLINQIQQDQWIFFHINLWDLKLVVNFITQNEINQLEIQVGEILEFNQLHDFQILSTFEIYLWKSNVVWFDRILIQKIQDSNKDSDFCRSDCKKCEGLVCYDEVGIEGEKSQNLQIKQEIQNSNYFLNYENIQQCKEMINNTCLEWPKFHGESCKNCQYLYHKVINQDWMDQFILHLNFQIYYYDYSSKNKSGVIAQIEEDLNVFILNNKDIYLLYRNTEQFYCQDDYTFQGIRCIKQQKKCQFFKEDCMLCYQNYSLQQKQCIRCQKNCLNCIIIKKRIQCILFINDYYIDELGLLKKCQKSQQDLVCLGREEIIQNLNLIGYQVCQQQGLTSFYNTRSKTCETIDFTEKQFVFYYKKQLKVYGQKLEIQDMLFLLNKNQNVSNKQLQLLIDHQQIARLNQYIVTSEIKNQQIEKLSLFEDLNVLNTTKELANSNKIVFQNVICYLGSKLFIKYQNQNFQNLIEIYQRAKIYFSIIQFDIIFIAQEPLQKFFFYNITLDYINYSNLSFILNLTFQINPSVLYSNCILFQFNAHKIILNNLTYINVQQKCETHIILEANDILINGISVIDSKIANLFVAKRYDTLKLSKLNILSSHVQDLIVASGFLKAIFNEITIIHSSVIRLIFIKYTNYIQISQLLFYDCYLYKDTIQIVNSFFQVFIFDLYYQNVVLNLSSSINIIGSFKNMSNHNIIYSNLIIQNSKTIDSSILTIEQSQDIQIEKIYLYNLTFLKSSFFWIVMTVRANISDIYMLNTSHENHQIFQIQAQDIRFQDIYFKTNILFTSTYLLYTGNVIHINNLNIYNTVLNDSQLLYVEADQTKFVFIQIRHIYAGYCRIVIQIGNVQQYISKLPLIIKNFIISKVIVHNSQLLSVRSHHLQVLQNLKLVNIKIINLNQNELLHVSNCVETYILSLKFYNILVESKYQFIILYLESQNQGIMLNLYFIKLRTDSHQSQALIIQAKSIVINIASLHFENILNLQLINLKSNLFYLQFWKLKLISTTQQLISNERYSQSLLIRTIVLQDFEIIQIKGQFLALVIDQSSEVNLDNIEIQNYENSQNLFQVFQQNFKKNENINSKCNIIISNILIINENQFNNNSGYIFLFQQVDGVSLYKVQIENIDMPFLLINQTNRVILSQLLLNKIILSDQLIKIISQSLQLSILNTTILNSFHRISSIFNFQLAKNSYLFIQNVLLINISTFSSVLMIPSNSQTVYIINLQLTNVSSYEYLIHSDSQIQIQSSQIIGGYSTILFQVNQSQIYIKDTLITNINGLCKLSESQLTQLSNSEIVESKIQFDQLNLTLHNSMVLGRIQSYSHHTMNLYLSLNNGESVFQLKQLQDNLFQFQFSNDNNFLYLPSGQDIQQYQYFDYKSFSYKRLYDSIAFVSQNQYSKIDCNLTQYLENQLINIIKLVLIPGVNRIDNLIVILNPLMKEKQIKLDLVCIQQNQTITYRTLIKTFNCQLGEYLRNDECKLCNIDDYLYSVGYNQAHCLFMDSEKIEKLKIGQIKLHKEFWRYSVSNKYIEFCENSNCLGGWKPGDFSCKIGYIGAVCSECDIYNIRGNGNYGQTDDQCKLCYFDNSIYLKLLFLIIYQLTIVFINLYTNKQQSESYLFIRIAKRKFTEILLRQNVNQASIIFKLYYNYLFTLYLIKESIEFGYYITFSFDLIYNPTIIAVPQFDCLIHKEIALPIQYSQLLYKIILPVLIFNVFVIIYIILIKIIKTKHRIFIIFVCLITVFQQNQYIIVQSLIKLSQRVKYSNIYWILEYKAVQYYSEVHQQYLIQLIVPLIILFIYINLMIFYSIKIVNQRIFNHLKLSLFIYKQYHNKYYYWEFIRLLFIYLIMLSIYSQDNQIFVVLLSIILCLCNHAYKPFILNNLNQLDQYISLLAIFSNFAYFVSLQSKQTNYFNILLIVIVSNVFLLKVVTQYFTHSFKIQYRSIIKRISVKLISVPYLYFMKYIDPEKIEYYYKVIRNSYKKSNNSLSAIFHQSKSNLFTPTIEIELTHLNIRQ